MEITHDPVDPCVPNVCGPYSQCRDVNGYAVCSCLPSYTGRSPNCRPECVIDADCSSNLACVNHRCQDVCAGSCAENALCYVVDHRAICTCIEGYTGDPFAACTVIRCKDICFRSSYSQPSCHYSPLTNFLLIS